MRSSIPFRSPRPTESNPAGCALVDWAIRVAHDRTAAGRLRDRARGWVTLTLRAFYAVITTSSFSFFFNTNVLEKLTVTNGTGRAAEGADVHPG
jgi:hypothetical protein